MCDDDLDNFEEFNYEGDAENYDSRCESEIGSDGENEAIDYERQKTSSNVPRQRHVPMTPIQESERSHIRSPLKEVQSTPKIMNVSRIRRNLSGEFNKIKEPDEDDEKQRDLKDKQNFLELQSRLSENERENNNSVVQGCEKNLIHGVDDGLVARETALVIQNSVSRSQHTFENEENPSDPPSKTARVRFDVRRSESPTSLPTSSLEQKSTTKSNSFEEAPVKDIIMEKPDVSKPASILKTNGEITSITSIASLVTTPEWKRHQKELDERFQRMCSKKIVPISQLIPSLVQSTPKRPVPLKSLSLNAVQECSDGAQVKSAQQQQLSQPQSIQHDGVLNLQNLPRNHSGFEKAQSFVQTQTFHQPPLHFAEDSFTKHTSTLQKKSTTSHLPGQDPRTSKIFSEDMLKPRRFTQPTDPTQTARTTSPTSHSDTMRTAVSHPADSTFRSRAPSAMSQMNQSVTMCDLTASSAQLAFGFVCLKDEKVLSLTLTNNSTEKASFKLSIKYPTNYKGGQVFRIVNVSTTTLNPKGQGVFSVHFHPLAHCSYTADLVFERTNLGASEYRFPCFGYGGRCQLDVFTAMGEKLVAGVDSLRVLHVDPRASAYHFALKNCGERSAFCVIFPLNENGEILGEDVVQVKPQRVIIEKNEMKNFAVRMVTDSLRRSHSSPSLASNRSVNEVGLSLMVYFGEERQRLRFKQYLESQRKRYAIYRVDFTGCSYEGEVPKKMKVVYKGDIEAFKECVRVLKIQLTDPRRINQTRPGSANSSYASIVNNSTFEHTLARPDEASPFRTPKAQESRHNMTFADRTVVPTAQRNIFGV